MRQFIFVVGCFVGCILVVRQMAFLESGHYKSMGDSATKAWLPTALGSTHCEGFATSNVSALHNNPLTVRKCLLYFVPVWDR